MPHSGNAQANNKRIAKNTVVLYIRMFISMVVSFYTSRVTLATLGVEDYGIYGIVGGIVGMLGFLNGAMAGATSRFIIYELGNGDQERVGKTFSSALIVHILIAGVVLIVSETVGLWYLNTRLVLPAQRLPVANWVFQASILTAMLTITQVPYNAMIIAYERLDVYAYVEMGHSFLKLVVAFLITVGKFDKLVLYSTLMLVVAMVIMIFYRLYCMRNFKECHFHWIWDKSYLKPLLSFSGWNLYGNFGNIVGNHGVNFVINAFFGVTVNAASSIAISVSGMVNQFATNAITAFRPAIIKLYAQGDPEAMQNLTSMAMCVVVYLYCLAAIPVFVLCHYLIGIWLVEVPPYAILFCRIVLISILFETLRHIVIINIHASGKVKLVSSLTGTLFCLSPVVLYCFYKSGFPVQSSFVIIAVINAILVFANILIAKYYIRTIKYMEYIALVLKILICCSCSLTFVSLIYKHFDENFLSLVFVCALSSLVLTLLFYFAVLKSQQRILVIDYIRMRLRRKVI